MKKLIAITLTIALVLGLLTIPAAAITPTVNMDKLRENAEAHHKNAVKAAANAAEKGELPGNVTVIVDYEDDDTETVAVEETVNENDEPVEETVNEFDEEVLEPEITVEAEPEPESETETITIPIMEQDGTRAAVNYQPISRETIESWLIGWWK